MVVSFSRRVKEEIVFNEFEDCCAKALVASFIKINGTLSLNYQGLSLSLRTENAKIASKIHKLLKELYHPQIEFLVSRKMKLKKNNVYYLRVTKAKEILDDLMMGIGQYEPSDMEKLLLRKECCRRAFLAGAFLASGSVNDPKTANYHLEMSVSDEKMAQFLQYLMNQYALNAKMIKRRGKHIVYLKASEKIGDFLRAIGTDQSVLYFEGTRIDRDFSNNLNRLGNCDIANEMKVLSTSKKQIEDIQFLIEHDHLMQLDEKTQHVALLRLAHPETNLLELSVEYEKVYGQSISKSGLHRRFKKLNDEASLLRSLYEKQ